MLYRKADVLSIFNLFLLAVLIVFFLISIRSLITRGYNKKNVKSPVSFQAASPKYAKKDLMEYESILKNNPFGFKTDTLKPLGGSSDMPLPASDIKLIGTISGDDMFSYAVFAGSDGKQEIYRSGVFISGTGLLKKVDNDKVYIENGDLISEIPVVQSLAIEQNKESLSNEPSSSAEQLDKGDYVIDQKIINEALDNPGRFLSQARLIPNMVDNHQEGFIVREVKSGGIHSLLGLKNDDILMRINDYDITNPEKALRAFSALKGANMVQLDIIRSGKRETMTYQIR
ncbi:MAG: type II secretion system protein N [Desulfobacterales bacterium]